MKIVKLLSVAVFLLSCTACLKKYTCAEALFHCPGCSPASAEHLEIPYHILDYSLPQACYLTLKEDAIRKITKGPVPSADMREMVMEYRACTDRTDRRNYKVGACLSALKTQAGTNLKIKQEYCASRKYVFDPERGVCVLPS